MCVSKLKCGQSYHPYRIVLVGNGFDIAHNLKTSYTDFVKANKMNPVLQTYEKMLKRMCADTEGISVMDVKKSGDWYSFEVCFEKLVWWYYQKEIGGKICGTNEIIALNDMFEQIAQNLFDYLKEEYLSHNSIKKIPSVERYFDDETLAISFNYTDTIKLYTTNYYYVHGSISDDNYIVLGFAIGDLPCMCNGDATFFHKDVQKEVLNFRRFAKERGYRYTCQELLEFKDHATSLWGNKGEYNEIRSKTIKKYAESNHYELSDEKFNYENVKEIVIMGHGLEADMFYLKHIFDNARNNLERIGLFTYIGESKEQIHKKISAIRNMSDVPIVLEYYEEND